MILFFACLLSSVLILSCVSSRNVNIGSTTVDFIVTNNGSSEARIYFASTYAHKFKVMTVGAGRTESSNLKNWGGFQGYLYIEFFPGRENFMSDYPISINGGETIEVSVHPAINLSTFQIRR